MKISFQISQLDLTNIEVLKDQLVGVDSTYFALVINDLVKMQEENEDFEINETVLCELINKIF